MASVHIDGVVKSSIECGLLVLVGIERGDGTGDAEWLSNKIISMRIFSDDDGKMNRDILECNGEILVVSQFTLHASTKKGNRPSFIQAALPDEAVPLYIEFCKCLQTRMNKSISTGVFGAMMDVTLINEGPVTIIVDSRNRE